MEELSVIKSTRGVAWQSVIRNPEDLRQKYVRWKTPAVSPERGEPSSSVRLEVELQLPRAAVDSGAGGSLLSVQLKGCGDSHIADGAFIELCTPVGDSQGPGHQPHCYPTFCKVER